MKIVLHGSEIATAVVGTCLAEAGHTVLMSEGIEQQCLAADHHHESDYSNEPGLVSRIERQLRKGQLRFVEGLAVEQADIHWIFDHTASFDQLSALIDRLVDEKNTSVWVTSHFAIGSYNRLCQQVDDTGKSVGLAYISLLVREGRAFKDVEQPDLVVIGSNKPTESNCIQRALKPYIERAEKVMTVPGPTVELIRNAINAMLATRLSFMNELAGLSENLHIDINTVRLALANDPRIGPAYLGAGCGYGGTSLDFALDVLEQSYAKGSAGVDLLRAVRQTNINQKELLFRKFWQFFNADVTGKHVAIWGGANRPGTSEITNSPVLPLLEILWSQGVTTALYDPMAGSELRHYYADSAELTIVDSRDQALIDADALFIVTNWNEFYNPDFSVLKKALKTPVIFDGRNLFDSESLSQLGIRYFGVGR